MCESFWPCAFLIECPFTLLEQVVVLHFVSSLDSCLCLCLPKHFDRGTHTRTHTFIVFRLISLSNQHRHKLCCCARLVDLIVATSKLKLSSSCPSLSQPVVPSKLVHKMEAWLDMRAIRIPRPKLVGAMLAGKANDNNSCSGGLITADGEEHQSRAPDKKLAQDSSLSTSSATPPVVEQ